MAAYGNTQTGGPNRPVVKSPDGLEITAGPGYGNTDNPSIPGGSITTVGAGTLTNAAIEGQLIYRTGPTGAYTDTFDTAANLDAGIGAAMQPGDHYVIWYSNQVAFAATIAGAAGVTLSSTKTSIAASALGCLVLQKVSNAVLTTPMTYNSSGQPAPTFSSNGVYKLYVL